MKIYEQQKIIDGILFETLVKNGAMNLKAHLKTVNDLNVFPIPDGDTGDNMFMTINGGLKSMSDCKGLTVGEKSTALAEGMLLNARGNSGVILSQLFAGIAKGLKDKETVTVKEFGLAFSEGVRSAYSSVSHPVEGTMLTVARESAEYASRISESYVLGAFLKEFVSEVSVSLNRTPELLPVLKEAGVIDSGGAGLLYIVEGMQAAAEGHEIATEETAVTETTTVDFSNFNENSVMEFGYCTEMLLQLSASKTDVHNFPLDELKQFLESIGDSVVAFVTGTVVKLHVHTMTPYKVMEYCHKYGEFLTVKVENMTLQHNGIKDDGDRFKVKKARRKFAVVTVLNGKGLKDTFLEMGVDEIIDGGQGNNPSIERFIKAFDEVNADHVFVLPNNGNIVMAAKQAAQMYTESDIRVIETKNIGQAYSALSMLDYSSDSADAIEEQLKEAFNSVVTGMVTSSVRGAVLDGVEINKGEYVGFSDKTMLVSKKDKVDAMLSLADKLDIREKSFLIVSYADTVTQEEKEKIEEYVSKNYPNLEYYSIDGGQEIYDFILILE